MPWMPCCDGGGAMDAGAAEDDATSLEVHRFIPAAADDVFAAWTDPELMRRWMSPVGRAEAEVDLRVGGRFRLAMVGQGTKIEHTGEYLEISPPGRLVFSWRSPYTGPEPSVVTVVLRPVEGGTELVLTHEGLPEEGVPSHRDGWGRMLDRLVGEQPARPEEGG
jgi:uncharacterized protein YndB with AHSA1/START domain